MCINKYIALFAKTDKEYIKHLEEQLLEGEDYKRCYICERVDLAECMGEIHDGDAYVCEGRCEREFNELPSVEDDEMNYQYAKRGY